MRLSLDGKNKYNHQRALNRQGNVSFRGLPQAAMKAVSEAMDKNKLFTTVSQNFETKSTMEVIRKHIGHAADVLLDHIRKDEIINQAIKEQNGRIEFKTKRPLRLIINGFLYPIAKIPFYLLYNGLSKLKRYKFIANAKWLKNFEKSSFYQATHSYMKKDDKLNALKGLMELGSRENIMGKAAREKAFLQNTAKTFDSKFGNYNGVHERALTRIVTGFIPAVFLANDAHNLSILCTNNKKEAQTEKELRFKQETKRVLSNAYIQLITLGALSKFINKSKGWFVGVTIATVLFTEIYSRLTTGKKIHFISAEEAKAINENEKMKKAQENMEKGLTFVLDEAPTALNVNINGVHNFSQNSFGNKFKDMEAKKHNKPEKKTKEKSRSIVTLNTVLKFIGGIIAAGFAVRYMKKIPAINKMFNNVSKAYNKIYTKITMKKNIIKKEDMQKIFDKLNKCGFGTIAQTYEKAVIDYQKLLVMPKNITKEIIAAVRQTGNEKLANNLEMFVSGQNNSKLLSNLGKDEVKHNFEKFMRFLKMDKRGDLIEAISKINKNGEINYPKLHKLFGKKENERYTEAFENIFRTDDNTLKLKLLNKVRHALEKAGKSDLWKSAEAKTMADIENKGYYDLDKIKIPVVKDVVDFCIEPFKFIWSWSTIPYRGIFKIGEALKSKPIKSAKDIDAVAKALNSLTKKVSISDKEFTDMFNEKIVKGFNNTTMSKIANSELSSLAKSASTLTTMSFLISDNYNMVMLKSNGEDSEEAVLKGKERAVQEVSRFFWQQLFINLFNNTFSGAYNSSLLGASVVNTASTTIGEICTRKAVSLPITASSKEEILELERKNLSGDGMKSKFFRFMSKLTGKQVLSERETKKK